MQGTTFGYIVYRQDANPASLHSTFIPARKVAIRGEKLRAPRPGGLTLTNSLRQIFQNSVKTSYESCNLPRHDCR